MEAIRIISNHLSSNTYVCKNGKNCIIIDCGAEVNEAENVTKGLNVLAIFLTHGHFDHAYNATEYAKKFECKIYCHKACKEYLQDPAKNYGNNFAINDFSNFIFFDTDTQIIQKDFVVKCVCLGGHSKSDVCFKIDNQIFVGDIIIEKGIGRFDLYGGSKTKLAQSLQKISSQDFKTLNSGHGAKMSKDDAQKVIKVWTKFLKR